MARQLLYPIDDEITNFIESLGIDPTMTKRVIIDIDIDGPVKVYVEMYASKGSLKIITNTLLAPKIKIIE